MKKEKIENIVLLMILVISIGYLANNNNKKYELIQVLEQSIEEQKTEKETYINELNEAYRQIKNQEVEIYELKCDLENKSYLELYKGAR